MAESTDNPLSYTQCFVDIFNAFKVYYSKQDGNYTFPQDFYSDIVTYGEFTSREVINVFILSISFTLLRIVLTKAVFGPIAAWFAMSAVNRKKFPESAWKGSYYTCMWGYLCYLLLYSRKYDYFYRPGHMFDDWNPRMEIPGDIYAVYMIQMSFYTSSMYTTIYMDSWRRDSFVMIFHHLITIGLSVFSYATRYHKIGILAIFVHDVCDIFLEFTKINVYLKTRGGKYHAIHEKLSTVGFLSFATVWGVFRLYLYPMKVMHTAAWATQNVTKREREASVMPFYCVYNGLLWIIMILNVYWFAYILNFVYKVLSGQMSEVEDTREDEVIDKIKSHATNGKAVNGKPASPAANGNGQHANLAAGDHAVVSNGVQKRPQKSRPKAE